MVSVNLPEFAKMQYLRTFVRIQTSLGEIYTEIPGRATSVGVDSRGRLLVVTAFKRYRVTPRQGRRARVRCLGMLSGR